MSKVILIIGGASFGLILIASAAIYYVFAGFFKVVKFISKLTEE